MSLECVLTCVYDTYNGADRLSANSGWVKRWMHWSGRGIVLRLEVATHVDMPFIQCIEEKVYASHLAQVVHKSSRLANSAPVTHSLEYVIFPCTYDTVHQLTSFEYC